MSEFGMPYMGSKDKIARSICMNFPQADHFYDLFGGGGSITHCMMLTNKKRYKHFHYNEIANGVSELFEKSINGDFSYSKFKPKWISRQEFHEKKEIDAYIRLIWSFGNNQKDYIFGENIEEYKRSMHMAVVFDEFNTLATQVLQFSKWPAIAKTIKQKRLYLRQLIEHYRITKIPECLLEFLPSKQLQELEQLRQLQELEQLERLQRLQQLQQLEPKLFITALDYRDVKIEPNSVVYCDIPYKNTAEYLREFDHNDFYQWADTRSFPVFISEYSIDDKRFKCVYAVDKRSQLSPKKELNAPDKVEKLYWNQVKLT
jgi:hypothetical protein